MLLVQVTLAQPPQAMKYQVIVRDAAGTIIADQQMAFRMTIVQGSATGSGVYSETHTVSSNDYGLVDLEIGSGTVVSGSFAAIAWGADDFFVKVEFDQSGGSDLQVMGVSQLLSVPYALHARTATTASCLTVETTEVYTGTAPTTWTDLDLSSAVGINYANVTLKVYNDSATPIIALFRQKGDPDTYLIGSDTNNMVSLGSNGVGQALIYTSDHGKIQWKASSAVPAVIKVVAFVK